MTRSDWIAASALALSAIAFIWAETHRLEPPEIRFTEEWSVEHLQFLPKGVPYPAARRMMEDLLKAFPPEEIPLESGYLFYANPFGYAHPHLRYTHTITIINTGDKRASGVKVEIDDSPLHLSYSGKVSQSDVDVEAPGIYSISVRTVDFQKIVEIPALHPGFKIKIYLNRKIDIEMPKEREKFRRALMSWELFPSKVRHVVSDTVTGKSDTRPADRCLKWLKRCVTPEDYALP